MANRADHKNEGPSGEKNFTKIEKQLLSEEWEYAGTWSEEWEYAGTVNSGSMRAHGHLTQGANLRNPRTKHKYLFAFTSITLRSGHIWARFLELPAQSLIGSPERLMMYTYLVRYVDELEHDYRVAMMHRMP